MKIFITVYLQKFDLIIPFLDLREITSRLIPIWTGLYVKSSLDMTLLLDSLQKCRVSDELADGAKWTTKDLSNYFSSFMKIRKVLVWKILIQSKVPK